MHPWFDAAVVYPKQRLKPETAAKFVQRLFVPETAAKRRLHRTKGALGGLCRGPPKDFVVNEQNEQTNVVQMWE